MDIMNILEPILYAVITTTVPIIITYFAKFLTTKKAQINSQVENEKLNNYIDAAIGAVNQAVLTVSQTYVDSLKTSGNFSEKAQNEAKNKAIEIATTLITDDVKNAVNKLYGDFDIWLNTTIESFVRENKTK